MPETFLVVCSANQCRSPLAAAVLREHLAERGIDADVWSAGTQAYAGSPATDQTRTVAARAGLDLRSHSSTRVDAPMLRGADVVLTLERAHLRDVIALDRTAWAKTFTLKELVRRGTTVGPRAGRRVDPRVAGAGRRRPATDRSAGRVTPR